MLKKVPWWLKICIKIVFSRLPISYPLWLRLGIFRHGRMMDCSYAFKVFQNHINRAKLSTKINKKALLELGPGDSVASALFAWQKGARATLIDTADFATKNVKNYQKIVKRIIKSKNNRFPAFKNRHEFLRHCNATYLTEGIESIKSLKANSFDFIFSQAVLEHVTKNNFDALLKQTFRVLKTGGMASHEIDLKDHLGGSLNNLRISEQIWESKLFSSSGFYTNRLRFSDILQSFKNAGFKILKIKKKKFKRLPLPKNRLANVFQKYKKDDLKIKEFYILLQK